MVKSINEAVVEARDNPEIARSLFALAPYEKRDPESLERLRAEFSKDGIPLKFCHVIDHLCDGQDMLIGYMRVSKADSFQAAQLQSDSLIKAGIDPPHIYEDQAAGKHENLDIKATMKKKLDMEMPAYLTLGACYSSMAWEAIGIGPEVGAMLSEVINAI